MAAVLALLNYVVSVLLSLLGLTQSRADQITVNKILAIVTDPVVGLAAVHANLATVEADLASVQGDVLALGSPQQSGAAVTLPATPPAGYGGASSSTIANDVWTFDFGSGDIPQAILQTLRRVTDVWNNSVGFAVGNSPLVYMTFNVNPAGTFPYTGAPPVNPADILSTDADVGSWLRRAYSTWTWQQDGFTGWWYTFENHTNGAFYYVRVTEGLFDYFKHFLYTPSSGPPQRSTLGDLAQIEGLIPVQYS